MFHSRVVGVVALCASWAAACSASAIATRKFLPPEYTAAGAVALDGSPYAYYVSPGAESTRFVVHQKGGGWCNSDVECAERSLTELGTCGNATSSFCPETIDYETFSESKGFMLLSANASINPQAHNWTRIFLPCACLVWMEGQGGDSSRGMDSWAGRKRGGKRRQLQPPPGVGAHPRSSATAPRR